MATENLSSILTALGGTRATSNPGDTAALRQLLGQLQGADYQGLLDSVFQQAAGKVPQIQVGLANALGARSGSNSAVAAALMDLQKQTAIAGTEAVTRAQLQNQNIQQAAAGNIASATRGTTQKSGTNLGQAASVLAALSGLKKSGLLQDLGLSSSAPAASPAVSVPAPVFNLDSPIVSAAPMNVYGERYVPAESFAVPAQADIQPQQLYDPIEFVPPEQATIGPGNPNIDFNVPDELYLADGGLVTAPGSRRSSNPTVQTDPVQAMQALLDSELLRSREMQSQQPAQASAQSSSSSGSGGATSARVAGDGRLVSQAAAINALSGLTGGPAIPSVGGFGLGTLANIANSRTGGDAAMAGLQALASGAGSSVGSAFAAGKALYDNNASRLIDSLLSLSPVAAVGNMASSLFGGPTAGSLLAGTPAQIPSGSGPVTEATLGLLGNLGITPGGGTLYGDSPAQAYAVPSSSVQATSLDSGYSGDTGGDSGGSTSFTAASTYANGGEVDGPGTGTSDSIKARLSDGEYVISADVVQKLGVDFFDLLQQQLHTPVRSK